MNDSTMKTIADLKSRASLAAETILALYEKGTFKYLDASKQSTLLSGLRKIRNGKLAIVDSVELQDSLLSHIEGYTKVYGEKFLSPENHADDPFALACILAGAFNVEAGNLFLAGNLILLDGAISRVENNILELKDGELTIDELIQLSKVNPHLLAGVAKTYSLILKEEKIDDDDTSVYIEILKRITKITDVVDVQNIAEFMASKSIVSVQANAGRIIFSETMEECVAIEITVTAIIETLFSLTHQSISQAIEEKDLISATATLAARLHRWEEKGIQTGITVVVPDEGQYP